MKTFHLVLLLAALPFSVLAQIDTDKSAFGRKMFRSFVQHDFDVLTTHLAPRNRTQSFRDALLATYRAGEEKNIIWPEVIVDDVTIFNASQQQSGGVQVTFLWDATWYEWTIYEIEYFKDVNEYKIISPTIVLRQKYISLTNDSPMVLTDSPGISTIITVGTPNKKSSKKLIYSKVELMPVFPGGDAAMDNFIYENIKYPIKAKQNNIEGNVLIRFCINTDGSVSNLTVEKKLGYGCDQEAMRVIKVLPQFKAGMHEGKKVNVWNTVNIPFELER